MVGVIQFEYIEIDVLGGYGGENVQQTVVYMGPRLKGKRQLKRDVWEPEVY